jgi:hypothetical protein
MLGLGLGLRVRMVESGIKAQQVPYCSSSSSSSSRLMDLCHFVQGRVVGGEAPSTVARTDTE